MWNEIDAAHLAHYGVAYAGEHKEHVIGKSFTLSDGFYKDFFGIQASVEEMVEQRTGVAMDFYAHQIPALPGAAATLGQLKALGLPIALATGSVSRLILPFLKRHDLEKYFDVVITGEMVKNGKPHPDIYLLAAAKVATAPQNCLVVEDALAGLQAGRAAGCKTVAIPDARWVDAAQFAGKADFEVEKLPDVVALVQKLVARE